MGKATLFIEVDNTGVELRQEVVSIEEFFLRYLGFPEMPPMDYQCRIIRPMVVFHTTFYDMVVFEVNWAKPDQPEKLGTMSRHFEKRGSVSLVRVLSETEQAKFAFVAQERFLFGELLEACRGFGPVRKELAEELDLSEDPEPQLLANIRINTGISMTKSAQGDIPVYLTEVRKKPGVGKGEATEKLTGVRLLTWAEIREAFLSGSITDPWAAYGLLILLMQERPDVFGEKIKMVIRP